MLIVAVDPGAGTGISTYDTITGEFYTEEAFGFRETCDRIVWHLSALNEVRAVCESYIITQKTAQLTQQLDPLKLIGVVDYECDKRAIPLKMQQPSARKTGEQKLKVLGWYRNTKDKHSNSSSGHLLVYLLSNGLLTDDDRLKLVKSL